MSEDLYGLLGVSKGASESEIKSAYRKQARKYHPDVNKDAGAEDTFKKIQTAYSILSDPQKKARYDQYGITDDSPGAGGGPGGAGFSGFEGFSDSFEDIFESFFGGGARGGGGGRRRSGPRQGEDLRYDLELTLEEVASGLTKTIEIYHLDQCDTCDGSGAKPGTSKSTCSHCKGSGQLQSVQRTMLGTFSQVTACHHCEGTGEQISHPCSDCHGRGLEKKRRQLEVTIPAGVPEGTRLRVTGEGNRGEKGGPAGDLYVFVGIAEHDFFQRDGDDVHLSIKLPFTQAILGVKIMIPTLTGEAKLKIPSGTQSGTVFRLSGKGFPRFRGYGAGDLYVTVDIALPKKLSCDQKKQVEKLSESLDESEVLSTEDYISYRK